MPKLRRRPQAATTLAGRGPQAEQGLVERVDELLTIAVQQRLDESTAKRVAGGSACVLAGEGSEQLDAVLAVLLQQHRGAHRGGPGAVAVPEERGERVLDLARAERLVGEQRELPAVERLAELAILVGERKPFAQIGGDLARAARRA